MARRRSLKGGATVVTGIDISGVAAFNPDTLKGLVLWIRPDPALLVTQTITEYANAQTPLVRAALIKGFGSSLSKQVITEIKSATPGAPNSLVPLEVDTAVSTRFPERLDRPGELPALDFTSYVHPITREQVRLTLVTKGTIELPADATYMALGKGIRFDYNELLDRLLVTAGEVTPNPKATQDASGGLIIEPTALLQELLVWNRPLAKGERELVEGYFAYRAATQHTLPEGHPYLPDMIADPSIRELAEPLRSAEDGLRIVTGTLDTAVGTARTKAAGAPALQREAAVRGGLTDAREGLRLLGRQLSRAVLAARPAAKGGAAPLDQILAAGGLARETFTAALAAAAATKKTVEDFIREVQGEGNAIAADTTAAMNTQTIDLARKEAATEELLGATEDQVARREQFVTLRERAAAVSGLGTSLLRERATAFGRELDLIKEAFDYQAKRRTEAIAAAGAAAATLPTGDWSARFPFLSQVRNPGGTFQEPLLETLAGKMAAIRRGLQEGDVPAAATRLDSLLAEASRLHTSWTAKPITAIFPEVYLQHLKGLFAEAARLDEFLTTRLKELQEDAATLAAEMEHLATYQTVVPAALAAATVAPEPEKKFLARLGPADAAILRAETVEVDESGEPLLRSTPLGALDLVLGFSGGPAAPAVPVLTTSILSRFPPERFPAPLEVDLAPGQLVELTREAAGHLVRLKADAAVPPVSLPKYAVRTGAAFILQNLGPAPLWIRNPGTVEDAIDLLGPGETVAYLYGGQTALDSPGYAYGRCPWVEGLLPYDVLAGTPRSATCAYHEGLKTFVYIDPTGTDLLRDTEGNAIEARRAADGCVYDADDYALSNPYPVRTVPMPPTIATQSVSLRQRPQIKVITDVATGLTICCGPGGPAAGEFGLLKIIQSPLVWMKGIWKTKGAYGDLEVGCADVGPGAAPQGLIYPAGLVFDRLFRSRFFRTAGIHTVFTTSQGTPLGAPSREACAWIRVPRDSSRVLDLITYKDTNGAKQAFLVKDIDLSGTGVPLREIPFVDLIRVLGTQKALDKARLVIYRYRSSVAYARAAAAGLVAKGTAIRALGEGLSESIRTMIDDTKGMIEERVAAFDELAVSVGAVEKAIAAGSVPNDVQISLGIMDLSLRDKVAQVTDLLDAIHEPVQGYMVLVESSTRLKGFVERLRRDATDLFKKGYAMLQQIQAVQTRRTGSLSLPEVEVVAARLRTAEQEVMARQGGLEAAAVKTYEYVTDLRNGLLSLQVACGEQFEALGAARGLLSGTLPRLLATAEREEAAAAGAAAATAAAQQAEKVKSLTQWAALVAEPGPGFIVRDAPDQPGPFAHAAMPSVERDIRPLATGLPDFAARWNTMADAFIAQREAVMDAYRRADADRIKEILKEPMNQYTSLAADLVAAISRTVAQERQAAVGALEEAKAQVMALDTLVAGLTPSLTEEERARIRAIQATVEGLGLDTMTVAQPAPDSNPFRAAAALATQRASTAAVQATVAKMVAAMSSFTAIRQEILDRLRSVVGTALTGLNETVDRLRAQGRLLPQDEAAAAAIAARSYESLADATDLLGDLRTLQDRLDALPAAV